MKFRIDLCLSLLSVYAEIKKIQFPSFCIHKRECGLIVRVLIYTVLSPFTHPFLKMSVLHEKVKPEYNKISRHLNIFMFLTGYQLMHILLDKSMQTQYISYLIMVQIAINYLKILTQVYFLSFCISAS
jgi:hypothetical protein